MCDGGGQHRGGGGCRLAQPRAFRAILYFIVLGSSISQRSLNQFSFIHVDKEDPAEEVNLGAKEEEEVTDEVVYDKKKVGKFN